MELTLLVAAFVVGFLVQRIGLPPLVGYLIAGFGLSVYGYESTELLETISDLGILLLLFGIGLKLRFKSLARPGIWGGASIQVGVTTVLMSLAFLAAGAIGLPLVQDLDFGQSLLIGFALAFSSTVFAVKALEDRGEQASLAGGIAVGILIMQDLFAVVFIVIVSGKTPGWGAVPVVVLVVLGSRFYGWLLDRAGHGEILLLLGFVLAVGVGAGLFEVVDLKADLGALLVGLLLSGHRRAPELADSIFGVKDLFLVGFFLSIGLGGVPGSKSVAVIALALVLLAPKVLGYLLLLVGFRYRSRTSWHATLTLATFSEFGLIVMALAADRGLIGTEWVTVLAVAVGVSFVGASILNRYRYGLFRRFNGRLAALQRDPIVNDDALFEVESTEVLVFGLGRLGAAAYDAIASEYRGAVLGIDRDGEVVESAKLMNRNVVRGDALDSDFWDRAHFGSETRLVILAMNGHSATLEVISRIREFLPEARIVATARYQDEVAELESVGVAVARDLFTEAGLGLAKDALDLLGETDRLGG